MIRVLFSVLAVVAAVLAIVLEQRLLYVVAAAMLLIVVILWIAVARRRHRAATKSFKPVMTAPPAPEENLKALGIMEIRPKESAPSRLSNAGEPATPSEPAEAARIEEPPAEALTEPAAPEAAPPATPIEESSSLEETPIEEPPEPAATTPEEALLEEGAAPASALKEFVIHSAQAGATAEAHSNGLEQADAQRHTETVLGPFLQSLRAALGAHTVCVLKQEEVAFDYQVMAFDSADDTTPSSDAFTTTIPLLTASMARQPVTVRRVDADDLPRHNLGYSARPEAIRRVALAPAPRPESDPNTYFLLADTPRTDLLNRPQARALLSQFARLLGVLLDASVPAPATTAPTPATQQPMRPRREIIAEEMEQARARDQLLALALVYLNRAEDIAIAGEDTVGDAEHLLKARLTQAARNSRVERFGELTYGVFYDGDLPEVEAWGAQIQETLARETGLLEGGVSIGIALLQDRHQTPDAFRADATDALREAYETGTCTILE